MKHKRATRARQKARRIVQYQAFTYFQLMKSHLPFVVLSEAGAGHPKVAEKRLAEPPPRHTTFQADDAMLESNGSKQET